MKRACILLAVSVLMVGMQEAMAQPSGTVLVPGGEFEMGDHHDSISDALPVHAVYVDSFYMDIFEVTNQEYANALNWALGQGKVYVGDGDVGENGVVYGVGQFCSTCSGEEEAQALEYYVRHRGWTLREGR